MSHPLIIRIYTKNESGLDDKITVTKLAENRLKVIYLERAQGESLTDIFHMSYHQFLTYIHRVFYLLVIDDDPRISVEFNVPGYPAILVHIPNLKERCTSLLEFLWSACLSWPSAENLPDE
jgi:hypothetical protein